MSGARGVTPNPPLSRKVIIGFLSAVVATVAQALVPGFHPTVFEAGAISTGVGYAASFIVKEEIKYLKVALTKRQSE